MRILITGANGLLGTKLADLLGAKPGVDVLATARGESRLGTLPANTRYQSLDITHEQEVEAAIAGFRPDSVIHTAAMTQVDQCETEHEACRLLNVEAVRFIAQSCARHGAHLVHLSTDFIFDGSHGPLDEEAEPSPISFYGQSKLDAEEVVKSMPGLNWAIARTILVYGITPDMSRSNIVLWVKGSLEQGKKIMVVDDQWRTPTLAEDLAEGCWLLAQKQAQGIYNLGGPDMLTPYDMAMATVDFFGLDGSLIEKTDGSRFTQPAKRPPRTGFIIDKARQDLGYNPRSFKEGLAVLEGQMKSLQAKIL